MAFHARVLSPVSTRLLIVGAVICTGLVLVSSPLVWLVELFFVVCVARYAVRYWCVFRLTTFFGGGGEGRGSLEVPKIGVLPCDTCSGGGLGGAGVLFSFGFLRMRGAGGVVKGERGAGCFGVSLLHVDGTGVSVAVGAKVGVEANFGRRHRGSWDLFLRGVVDG